MSNNPKRCTGITSKCMHCTRELRECEWMLTAKPQKGMKVQSYMVTNGNKMMPVYVVTECPLYKDNTIESLEKYLENKKNKTILSSKQLAKAFGLPLTAVYAFVKQGMPKTIIKYENKYNCYSVLKWLKEK